jgi:hypothetical protein
MLIAAVLLDRLPLLREILFIIILNYSLWCVGGADVEV